jgi:NAD(P)-dependent dehydrogenase (short-subunit alcohol dehydrogenase family)
MGRRTRPPLPACFCSAAMAALSPARRSPLTAARNTTNGRRAAAVQGSRSGNNDPTNASPLERRPRWWRLSTRREPRWRVPVGARCRWWLHRHYLIRCRPPGSAGLAGYCATKGGVRLFAKAVAMERAPEADGIPVNTVHPGVIDTPIWTKLPVSAGSNAPIDPNEVAKAGVPLGRAGQAQDIANGVPFLASDASSYRRVRNW